MAFGTAFVDKLLQRVGPGRFVLQGSDAESLRAELLRRGCEVTLRTPFASTRPSADAPGLGTTVARASTVVFCGTAAAHCRDAAELIRSAGNAQPRYLVIAPSPEWRRSGPAGTYAWWAQAALAGGYRRSPSAFSAYDDAEQSGSALREMAVFERLPPAAPAAATAACPHCGRAPDFARSLGPATDAQAVLHAFATEWIRPSDTVVVLDPGAGAGAAVLAAQSRAATVIGVDRCPLCTGLAQASYGAGEGLRFLHHDPRSAATLPLPDHAADVLVALGTDNGLSAGEIRRLLKPDGRLVTRAAPARRVEPERGDLLLEAFYDIAGTPRGTSRVVRRDFATASRPDLARHAGDAMVVLGRDPLALDTPVPYRHPHFAPCAVAGSQVTDFGAHYQRPWLYRALVQMGERLADDDALIGLALRTLDAVDFGSADTGAALTVIGYHLLAQEAFDRAADWLDVAGHYIDAALPDPHALRWQISLRYCRALMAQAQGQRDAARQDFERVARIDALAFSPLLATKQIAAAFWAGIMALVDGRAAQAREWFLDGVRAGRAALHADDANAIGNPECPLDFGFQELAEVSDMASQCVSALRWMPLFERSPGQFWRQVDLKRFGLASWAKHLERENRLLRQVLAERAR